MHSLLCVLTPIHLIILDEVFLTIFSNQLKLYILFHSFAQHLVTPPLFLIVVLGNLLFSFAWRSIVPPLQISSKVPVSLHISNKDTQLLEQSTAEQRSLCCKNSKFITSKTTFYPFLKKKKFHFCTQHLRKTKINMEHAVCPNIDSVGEKHRVWFMTCLALNIQAQ
jgi:hypothetical protein